MSSVLNFPPSSSSSSSFAESVASRITLVSLSKGRWSANKLHRSETAAERARHATSAVRVYNTLTESPELAAIAKKQNEIYLYHVAATLPGATENLRALPCGKQIEHATKIQQLTIEHDVLVAAFIATYSQLQYVASTRPLYDAAQWNSRETVARKFYVHVQYLPAPAFGQWSEWITETAALAQAELRDRIVTALQRTIESCTPRGDGKFGKLYETVFTQFDELTPDLNIANDPQIARALRECREIASLDAETLKSDKRKRIDVSKQASQILSIFGPSAHVSI